MPLPEREWLSHCENPDALLYDRHNFPNPISERKHRLLAAAFCRRVWHLITDERGRQAVEVTERYLDGQATPDELRSASAAVEKITINLGDPEMWYDVAGAAYMTADQPFGAADVAYITAQNVGRHAARAMDPDTNELDENVMVTERAAQCNLVREILGNPFRIIVFDPSWRTTTVVALAGQMYEARDFSALPILADALEEAGCDNDDMLTHCRGDGPHVRGCWVVDLLLGKA
jgi:hypothetical protein